MRHRDEIILPDGRRLPFTAVVGERSTADAPWTERLPVFVRSVNPARDRRQQPRADVRARLFDVVA